VHGRQRLLTLAPHSMHMRVHCTGGGAPHHTPRGRALHVVTSRVPLQAQAWGAAPPGTPNVAGCSPTETTAKS
jgi:hypothetical protein